MASIVDCCDDAIIGMSLDGIILSWNSGAEKIFGYSAEEVKGRPISLLFPEECRDEALAILDRIRQGERVDHHQTVCFKKNGEQIHVSLTVSPVRDTAGRIMAASTIVRDITENKRTEQRLRESESLDRALTDSSADGVMLIQDREDRFCERGPR